MSAVVLDTNIVSFLMRADPLTHAYEPHLHGQRLTITFMTVAEMFEGAYRAGWGPARLSRLEQILRGYLVIPSSPALCTTWARIRTERRHQPIGVADAWIAAAALAHAVPLVTHNPKDFAGIAGLSILTAVG